MVPVLRDEDGSLQHSLHRFPGISTSLVMHLVPMALRRGWVGRHWCLDGFTYYERRRTADWAVGAVHCIRAAALDGPPYSERWFMYAEDMDLGWRLRRTGWRTELEPAAQVMHIGNAAGSVEFGEDRQARWLDATYDWFVLTRGSTHARAWAAANVLGLTVKLLVLRTRAASATPHRSWLSTLRRLHLQRLWHPEGNAASRRPPEQGGARRAT